MLTVVPVSTPEQVAIVRELFREYARDLGHPLDFQDFQRELATLPGRYAPPGGAILVAQDGDRVAGCVALRPGADDSCEMKRLYVRPMWRRQGLARRLSEEMIAIARRASYGRIVLDTLAHMTAARRLYESLGFRERPPYYHNPLPGAVYYELAW